MEEQNNPLPSPRAESPAPEQSNKGKKVLLTLLVLILLGGLGYTGYLWYQSKQDAKNLASQISSLEAENAKLKEQAAQKPEEPVETSYEAEVGKFSLVLPESYVIIEELDGDAEGGPATQLAIGQETDSANVVDTNLNKKVSITATLLTINNTTFTQAVDGALQDAPDKQKQESVTVDGETAEVYTISGLYESRSIFFSKNGIFYEITADVDNEETKKAVDDIIEGFKFN